MPAKSTPGSPYGASSFGAFNASFSLRIGRRTPRVQRQLATLLPFRQLALGRRAQALPVSYAPQTLSWWQPAARGEPSKVEPSRTSPLRAAVSQTEPGAQASMSEVVAASDAQPLAAHAVIQRVGAQSTLPHPEPTTKRDSARPVQRVLSREASAFTFLDTVSPDVLPTRATPAEANAPTSSLLLVRGERPRTEREARPVGVAHALTGVAPAHVPAVRSLSSGVPVAPRSWAPPAVGRAGTLTDAASEPPPRPNDDRTVTARIDAERPLVRLLFASPTQHSDEAAIAKLVRHEVEAQMRVRTPNTTKSSQAAAPATAPALRAQQGRPETNDARTTLLSLRELTTAEAFRFGRVRR